MIVTCPDCRAQYRVKASAFGARGRSVRCSRCACEWYQVATSETNTQVEAAASRSVAPNPAGAPEADDRRQPSLEDLRNFSPVRAPKASAAPPQTAFPETLEPDPVPEASKQERGNPLRWSAEEVFSANWQASEVRRGYSDPAFTPARPSFERRNKEPRIESDIAADFEAAMRPRPERDQAIQSPKPRMARPAATLSAPKEKQIERRMEDLLAKENANGPGGETAVGFSASRHTEHARLAAEGPLSEESISARALRQRRQEIRGEAKSKATFQKESWAQPEPMVAADPNKGRAPKRNSIAPVKRDEPEFSDWPLDSSKTAARASVDSAVADLRKRLARKPVARKSFNRPRIDLAAWRRRAESAPLSLKLSVGLGILVVAGVIAYGATPRSGAEAVAGVSADRNGSLIDRFSGVRQGLVFVESKYDIVDRPEGPALEVWGVVANNGPDDALTPTIEIISRAENGDALQQWLARPEKHQLKPGETSRFTARMMNPEGPVFDVDLYIANK